MSLDENPLIIAFVGDLYFTSRIESVAQNLGFRVSWFDRAEQLMNVVPGTSDPRSLEHPAGQKPDVLDYITLYHPALILFDLNNNEVPWRDWIILIKTSPATRRIPVVCFGSHMDVVAMKAARAAGAEAVVARSKFVKSLDEMILKYARRIDSIALRDACRQPLSETAVHGLELFNRGEYFEAHEVLEAAWNLDDSPAKELYRAVLQVAVTYYQIERGNYRGVMKMFLRLRQWIDPLPDECRGVNVAQLRQDMLRVREAVIALGPGRISEFNRSLFRPVVFTKEINRNLNELQ